MESQAEIIRKEQLKKIQVSINASIAATAKWSETSYRDECNVIITAAKGRLS